MADEEEGQIYTIQTNRGPLKARLTRAPSEEEAQKIAEDFFASTKAEEGGKPSSFKPLNAERTDPLLRAKSTDVKQPGGLATDLMLEAGLPAAAQYLAAETGPVGMGVAGGFSSALGNTLAQLRRINAGEQEDFSGGQLAAATVTGAWPVAGPQANAARVARPIVSKAFEIGKTGAKLGVIGAAGEDIKLRIDEGRGITSEEAIGAAALPALIGGSASGLGMAGEAKSMRGKTIADNINDYSAVKARPTWGMLDPERYAVTEAKKIKSNPKGEISQQADAMRQGLNEGMQNIAPNPQEGATIFKTASPLIRQVSSAEEELGKLNDVAKKANEATGKAFTALGEAKAAGQADVAAAATKEAERLSADAFNANLKSATENAQELATSRAVGQTSGVDPATGRDLFVEHVSQPTLGAFEKRSAELYSVVDNQKATFDAKPILSYARQQAAEVTGGLPKKLDSAIAMVTENLGTGEPVSLQALRNARADLLRRARMGQAESSNEERLIKGVAAKITEQIDAQAVKALGVEGGKGLLAANKFYSEAKDLFDRPGVDALFSSKPNDDAIRKVVSGMEKSGINSDEYKNVQDLITHITKGSPENKGNPELGKAISDHFNDIVKKSVVFDASRVSPSSEGALVVDKDILIKSLRNLGKVPGTLEQLGLGSGKALSELETLFAKYPEATNMTSKDWDQILSSPAFRESYGKPLAQSEIAANLKETLAASQADNQIVKAANLKAAGRNKEAQDAFSKATDTLRTANGDVAAAQQRYEALLKDPVALAFNNPNLSTTDFNTFAKALFDPKANKLTNEDVAQIANSLRQSPTQANKDLLLRLQERYIADKIAAYHSTPVTSAMLKHPDSDAVALFFNPVNPGDAANEVKRARALLDPAQMSQLAGFAKTAKAVGQYEKLAVIPEKSGSYNIPVVGDVRRGLDAVVDLYRGGKYDFAAVLLADPKKYSDTLMKVGDDAQNASVMLKQFGVGAGRTRSNRRDK